MGIIQYDDQLSINSFLGYGYRPQSEINLPHGILEAAQSDSPLSGQNAINHGPEILRKTFERSINCHSESATHVLPLSGGLDSRTILGGLIENVSRNQIVTLTFGTPGTGDFKIGQQIADLAGVKNYAIDLRPGNFPWTEERMVRVAQRYERPTHLFRAMAALLYGIEQLDVADPVYWSGYMGGALAGSTLPKHESMTWNKAIKTFLSNNYTLPHLTSNNFHPQSVLPNKPIIARDVLSFDEQLDYGIRQHYYIRDAATVSGIFETPYLEEPWLSFMLNVPLQQRYNKQAFKKIALRTYPALFDGIPTDNNAGLPIGASEYHRKARLGLFLLREKILTITGRPEPAWITNHFDWNIELRRSKELRKLIGTQLADLRNRECVPWINLDNIWKGHFTGKNNGAEIRQLASLELFLKAAEQH